MVWGMRLPSTFGEFWPNGEFEGEGVVPGSDGWGTRLEVYYNEQMPEEQRALFDDGRGNGPGTYAFHVSEKFIRERGTVTSPDHPPISSIEPQEPPRSFETEKIYNSLGSLIKLNNRMLAADEALKDVIERLEPGVHEFFPIEIRMPRGRVFPKHYHVLVIGQYFDSFSPEKSREGACQADGPDLYFIAPGKQGVAGLAFSRQVFGEAHLWRERRLREELTCLSDELKSEIDRSGLRIPNHYQMKDI